MATPRDRWQSKRRESMRAPMDGVFEEIKRRLSMVHVLGICGVQARERSKIACVWHPDERTNSCHVYANHVHAYDCARSGDIFDVYEALTGKDRAETLRELAHEAGVQLPELTREDKVRQERRTSVRALVELIAANTHQTFRAQRTPGARTAAEWLTSRGLKMSTALEAGLGVADGWSTTVELIRSHSGHSGLDLAAKAGLVRAKSRGEGVRDHLHHSVIIPIRRAGKTETLVGRAHTGLLAEDGRQAKTLKLPVVGDDTPDALAAPSLYWPRGGRDGREPVYVVEGEIDALTLQQAEFQAVGLLGAAAAGERAACEAIGGGLDGTIEDRVYIIPDRDNAGRQAALKMAGWLGVRLHVVDVPRWSTMGWKDPNDALMGHMATGRDIEGLDGEDLLDYATVAVHQDISEATEVAEPWYLWETRNCCADNLRPEDVAQLVSSRVGPVLGGIANRAVRDAAIAAVSRVSGVASRGLAYEAKTNALRPGRGEGLEVIDGGGERQRRETLVLPHELEAASQVVLAWMGRQARDERAVYQRGRELVRILPAVREEGWMGVQLEPLSPATLREYIHAAVDVRIRKGDEIVVDNMPLALAEYVLAKPAWPMLGRITQVYRCPVVDREGNVVTRSGYCDSLHAWVDLAGLEVPEVSEAPTAEELQRAVGLIGELLYDFPFRSRSDAANAVGLGLLPFLRPMISGVTAPHFITAATEGTGKTLLAQVLAHVAIGGDPLPMTQCKDDDEWEKRLGAAMRKSPAIILIDNIAQKQRLDSGVLASWMTSRTPEFRELGKSLMVRVRNDAAWVLTGNNPGTSAELARRMIWIRIVSDDERPSDRQGFRHVLPRWGLENRAELCWAFLTLIRTWVSAGSPSPASARRMGSFDEHVAIVAGVLEAAGIHGFGENRDEHYQAATSDLDEWRALFERWWDRERARPIGARQAVELAVATGVLDGVLGDGNERSQRTRMANAMLRRLDRVIRLWPGEGQEVAVRLTRAVNGHAKTQSYCLERVVSDTPTGPLLWFAGGQPPDQGPAKVPQRSRIEEPRPSQGLRDLAGPAGPCFSTPGTDKKSEKKTDPSLLGENKVSEVTQGPASPDGAEIVDCGTLRDHGQNMRDLDQGEHQGPAHGTSGVAQPSPRGQPLGFTQDPDDEGLERSPDPNNDDEWGEL